jgi:hypothetical protein
VGFFGFTIKLIKIVNICLIIKSLVLN